MVILTLGTFDLPHYGHYRLLKRLDEIGIVAVGLNTDEFVLKYKGLKPVMNYEERRKTLKEWGYYVFSNNQTDGSIKDVIETVEPNIIAIGTDWLKKDYLKQVGLTVKYLEGKNISLLYTPYTYGISTTEIKRRLYNEKK